MSDYVFCSDIAYDWNITLEDIERDTLLYHCDHSYPLLRRSERLRYPFAPQPPTNSDWQNYYDYLSDSANFQKRKDYVEGSHDYNPRVIFDLEQKIQGYFTTKGVAV